MLKTCYRKNPAFFFIYQALLCLCLFTFPCYLSASVGIQGGPIYSLAVTPDTSNAVYAGTGTGIYKSINGENIWLPVNEGLASDYVYDIIPDSITGTVLYAATKEGVYSSTDGGAAWTESGLADYQTFCVTVNPVTTTYLAAGTPQGVFISSDGGSAWSEEATGPPNVYATAVNPQSPLIIYAGSFGGGVYKSTDFGTSWSQTGSGPQFVNHLAINPTTPATLYAGTASGLYKSTTSGTNWASTGDDFQNTPVYGIAVNSSSPSTVYVATDKGIYKTTDAGSSWAAINNGITTEEQQGPFAREIVIDQGTPSILYAGTYSGAHEVTVYKSTDSGASWGQMNRKLSNTTVYCLAFDPENTRTVYAGTSTLAVLKSTNGGQSWGEANEGFTSFLVRALAVNPDTSVLYAGAATGLFISSDDGVSWEAASPKPEIYSLAVDPYNKESLYTGTNEGVFFSSDDGASWALLDNNLTNPYIYSLAFHPADPGTLYAGSKGYGVFKSTSSGASWEAANEGLDYLNILSLAVDRTSPYAIYAGTENGGLYRSTNEGELWSAAGADLSGLTVKSIAINPDDTEIIYAGTENNGFYRSTDSGATWERGSADIEDKTVYAVALDPQDSQTLYAALEGSIQTYTFNSPPYIPSAPSPSDGAVQQEVTPTLRWTGGDPDAGDTVSYKVYFGTGEQFDNSTATVAVSSYVPGTLQLSRTYYWKVTAVDSHNEETESNVWQFTTSLSNPPLTPSSPSPADGAKQQKSSITLSWTGGDPDSSDTVSYDVYLGPRQTPSLVKSNTSETSYKPAALLRPGATYYWKIVSRDNNGFETEGPVWSFTTELFSQDCIARILLEKDEKGLHTLRRFRDEILSKNGPGKQLIELYYLLSPLCGRLFEKNPSIKHEAAKILLNALPKIDKILSERAVH